MQALELSGKTLGERVVEAARLLTAMHLDQVLRGEPVGAATRDSGEPQQTNAGGAGMWPASPLGQRLTDGAHRFTDEAPRRMDAAKRK